MPIPELRGDLKISDIIKKYEDYGWKKEVSVDWVELMRDGRIIKRPLVYKADSMPCGIQDDRSYQLTFVSLQPTGVYWSCALCRRTKGPLSLEEASSGNRPIEAQTISLEQAWEIIGKTGQRPPIGLGASGGQGSFRIVQ